MTDPNDNLPIGEPAEDPHVAVLMMAHVELAERLARVIGGRKGEVFLMEHASQIRESGQLFPALADAAEALATGVDTMRDRFARRR